MPALTWSPKAMLGALGGGWEKMKQGRLTEDRAAGSLDLRRAGSGVWAQTPSCGGTSEGREHRGENRGPGPGSH